MNENHEISLTREYIFRANREGKMKAEKLQKKNKRQLYKALEVPLGEAIIHIDFRLQVFCPPSLYWITM